MLFTIMGYISLTTNQIPYMGIFKQQQDGNMMVIWQCVKTLYPCSSHQNSWDLWMFIPLKMVLIGIDPYPYLTLLMAKSAAWVARGRCKSTESTMARWLGGSTKWSSDFKRLRAIHGAIGKMEEMAMEKMEKPMKNPSKNH